MGSAALTLLGGLVLIGFLLADKDEDGASVAAIATAVPFLTEVVVSIVYTAKSAGSRKRLLEIGSITPFPSIGPAPFREGLVIGNSVVAVCSPKAFAILDRYGAWYLRAWRGFGITVGLTLAIVGAIGLTQDWDPHPALWAVPLAIGLVAGSLSLLPGTVSWEADRQRQTLRINRIIWCFAGEQVELSPADCTLLQCTKGTVTLVSGRGKYRLLQFALPPRKGGGWHILIFGHAGAVLYQALSKPKNPDTARFRSLVVWRTRRIAAILSVVLCKRLETDARKAAGVA